MRLRLLDKRLSRYTVKCFTRYHGHSWKSTNKLCFCHHGNTVWHIYIHPTIYLDESLDSISCHLLVIDISHFRIQPALSQCRCQQRNHVCIRQPKNPCYPSTSGHVIFVYRHLDCVAPIGYKLLIRSRLNLRQSEPKNMFDSLLMVNHLGLVGTWKDSVKNTSTGDNAKLDGQMMGD